MPLSPRAAALTPVDRSGLGAAGVEAGSGRGTALELAVALPGLLERAVAGEPSVVQYGGARAEQLCRVEAVRDVAEGHPGGAEVGDALPALLLEALVAHRQDLVDDED